MKDVVKTTWESYRLARERGHDAYVKLAEECERYFIGNHWSKDTKDKLGDRPAITVNLVLATMSTAFGQMLENYTEVSFFAKDARYEAMSTVLGTLVRGIYQENRLRWHDADMAMDGFIGGRGFLDVRVGFKENLRGDIEVKRLDPRDVIIDGGASEYLPSGWTQVHTTRMMTIDDVESLYGKAKADKLRHRSMSSFPETYDMVKAADLPGIIGGEDARPTLYAPSTAFDDAIPRRFRVVERQYKKISRSAYFVDLGTGETRVVPDTWEDARIEKVILAAEQRGVPLRIITRAGERIRMTVVAADILLYDEWSPYPTFTVVPYFPYFRWGKTMGIVENLKGLQDAMNKTLSQTLHVINTTANSGWIVKTGTLVNMTMAQLERRGAETGLALEVTDVEGIKKIQPNNIPQGLDRITQQLSDWVKYVSGVSDSMRGFDRGDMAAKSMEANQKAGAVSLSIPFENLARTRDYLAEVILRTVQVIYTEHRVRRIAPDAVNGDAQAVEINRPDGAHIINDVTAGEYAVSVTFVPPKEAMDSTQYARGLEMLAAGIPVPDWVIVEASGLHQKDKIMQDVRSARDAQSQAGQAEQGKTAAEAAAKNADAENKSAQAQLLRTRAVEVGAGLQALTPKQAQEGNNRALQTTFQREKMYLDDDFRHRKLAVDALGKQQSAKATEAATPTTEK